MVKRAFFESNVFDRRKANVKLVMPSFELMGFSCLLETRVLCNEKAKTITAETTSTSVIGEYQENGIQKADKSNYWHCVQCGDCLLFGHTFSTFSFVDDVASMAVSVSLHLLSLYIDINPNPKN